MLFSGPLESFYLDVGCRNRSQAYWVSFNPLGLCTRPFNRVVLFLFLEIIKIENTFSYLHLCFFFKSTEFILNLQSLVP